MLTKPDLNKPAFEIFSDTKKDVEQSLCVFCKTPINEMGFRDELSKKEYSISGLCQKCQDNIFG